MTEILEFLESNYVWLLGGMIVILLAIIGYFADKTNFGQGKREEKVEPKTDEQVDNNLTFEDIYGPNLNSNPSDNLEVDEIMIMKLLMKL